MLARLKRYAYAPLAALALWAVLLALSPAMASAKESSQINDPQGSDSSGAGVADYVVVLPGDSLWSISERQLGPNATPPQIANGVERIYALNQDQIGADPNTIYVGQRFVLPSALERHAPRQAPEPTRAAPGAAPQAAPARGAKAPVKAAPVKAAPVKAAPRGRVAQSRPDGASRPTAGEAGGMSAKAPEAAVSRRLLPDLPDEAAGAPVPVVRSLAADGTPRSPVAFLSGIHSRVPSAALALVGSVLTDDRYAGRQLFGLALILMSLSIGAFTLVVAIIRPPRLTISRRERKKRLYRPAAFTYDAAPLVGLKLEERALPRHARGTDARQGLALSARQQRMNRRRKIVGGAAKVPFAPGEWDISEPLRRSLESFPLQPGDPMDQVLAELRPQVEDELRLVALVEGSRHLSERERRQASALRSLLALEV